MFNIPVVLYQGTLNHRVLIVVLPEELGLFSPTVLEGKATAGGLEALQRGSHAKLAQLLPLQELSVVPDKRLAALRGAGGLVLALQHSSGLQFTINTFSRVLADRIRQAVSR
ncbi:MAG: hypothetical protein ABSH30_10940 [Acidimicrobiales bacterium]|jgi:hypothetical protein